jgi:SAM-dependent methyltransferase
MSQRISIDENVNDSKNTRLSIQDLAIGDARPDILAHVSRYSKIAKLFLTESKAIGRPLDVLDIGCGELWALKILYKAHVCKKSEVVGSYVGVDIDHKIMAKNEAKCEAILNIFNAELLTQDVTVNPDFPLQDESIDFAYSTEVIEHMKQEFVAPWLDSIHRVLRPGGLVYISTPNHDGSNSKLPADHVYEWGYQELKDELESRWELIEHTGTFIQLNNFKRANAEKGLIGDTLLRAFHARFDTFWLRNVLAAPYPEAANNVAWILRKK